MANWKFQIELGDIFRNHRDVPFNPKNAKMVVEKCLEALHEHNMLDLRIEDILCDVGKSTTSEEFYEAWNRFYDWADLNLVWVDTGGFA